MKRMKRSASIRLISVISVVTLFLWGAAVNGFSAEPRKGAGEAEFSSVKCLDGQWVRPDGAYRLVIKDIAFDGTMTSFYYNPRSINVHKANWTIKDDSVHLFVELRDENYPGSSYSLKYIKEKDTLEGSYFQAVQNVKYHVAFIRSPNP
jgi:hypothetical protein